MATRESTATHPSNLLGHSASSYLRSARHQPVHWHPWGPEAFRRAQSEDKPILLDIGAVWCHWCHVMDRESYENAQLAQILNQHFVAIKVDRDERPDVDARYQSAVSAISGQGGWPLTAFLTPTGEPFFGGTYFPAEDRFGRPGFQRVLLTMAQVWKDRREEALDSARSVMAAIEQNEGFSGRGGDLNLALAAKLVDSILKQFDTRNGGFGSQPKFPHPGAIDLLIESATRTGNRLAREAASVTLTRMSQGGVYDQLAGGFHRYSVDERWIVPHFEKMLYDNTELLRNYVHAYQSFVKPEFAQVANEIIRWLDTTMTDRERGGFFASQDADIDLEDDGDYFTWTKAEAQAVLTPAEWSVASRYWDIGEIGDMHHNPQKNVLHLRVTVGEVARETNLPVEEAAALLSNARTRLLEARQLRPTPFIDRTLYTGWNAMAVTAYLEAARVLRLHSSAESKDGPRDFALKTLDRLLVQAWDGSSELAHVIAYPDNHKHDHIAGTLDDYAFTIHACIDAWISCAGSSAKAINYYRSAVALAETMIRRFFDKTAGAFVDTALDLPEAARIGALVARRKPLQDSPTPAGNPTAASALLRLYALSNREDFLHIAEDTLSAFAGIVEHFGLYAGSYGLALTRLLLDPLQVVIIGRGAKADALEAAATALFATNKTVVRLHPRHISAENLPPALAETIPHLPQPEGATAWAVVCRHRSCLPPITDPETLANTLEEQEQGTSSKR